MTVAIKRTERMCTMFGKRDRWGLVTGGESFDCDRVGDRLIHKTWEVRGGCWFNFGGNDKVHFG